MEKQFTNIYNKNIWGNGSGKGSSPDYNKKYIEFLESFIKEKNIQSIYDLGCGDWQFSQFVDWNGATYIGADCVKSVIQKNQNDYSDLDGRINFIHMDISNSVHEIKPNQDLIILKDILQHWSNIDIIKFMDILVNQGHKYILLINGYKEAKGSDRTIENRYRYAKIDCRLEPLCKYKPEILFTYRFKQVALIS
tara:strand:+ start:2899 stop:3480 length:582 start_codon:yes stop_codon:yes gene_type:complete